MRRTRRDTLIPFLVLGFFVFYIFHKWFTFLPLSSGDWSYNFVETIQSFLVFPSSWNQQFGGGLGGNMTFVLGLESFYRGMTGLLATLLHLPWIFVERLVWYWPFLIISVLFSYLLFKRVLGNTVAVIASFIYLFNSYTLMLVAGGQMGVAMGYALAPWVLGNAIELFGTSRDSKIPWRTCILVSLSFALQLLFDFRIAYVTVTIICIYALVYIRQLSLVRILTYGFTVGPCVLLLHSFWLLPLFMSRDSFYGQLGAQYTTVESVKFFSFTDFSHALSLLHPNWPENIFGKTFFLRPEFLVIALIAYISLLFVSKSRDKGTRQNIMFFALLGLIGSFFAKGAKEPVSGAYLWFFDHVPGFVMFRDSTKFFVLIVISYSILIPYSLSNLISLIKQSKWKMKKYAGSLIVLGFLLFWVFTLREAVMGQLSGTFRLQPLPQEYIQLKDFIYGQKQFFRTFWIPQRQRYGFTTASHPAIEGLSILRVNSVSEVAEWLRKDSTRDQLARWSVRYIIVPYDSRGELFLKDRKYDEQLYQTTVSQLRGISWLKHVQTFGKIIVFEVPAPRDHFWLTDDDGVYHPTTYTFIIPTKYTAWISPVAKKRTLVFSETFDTHWVARGGSNKIYSIKTEDNLNSFPLAATLNGMMTIEYEPQRYVGYGLIVSGATLVLLLGGLFALRAKRG